MISDVTRAAAAASSSRHRRSRLSRVCDVARMGHRLIVSHMSTPRARFQRLLRSCVTRRRVQETPNSGDGHDEIRHAPNLDTGNIEHKEEEEEEDTEHKEEEEDNIEQKQEEEDEDIEHKEEEHEQDDVEHKEEDDEDSPPSRTEFDYLTRIRRAIEAGQQDIALAFAYEAPSTLHDNEMVRSLLQSDWVGAVWAARPESERSETTVTVLATMRANSSDNIDIGRSILNAINAGSILQNEVRSILSIDLSEILSHSSPLDLIEMRLNGSSYGSRGVSSETLKHIKQYKFCKTDHVSCTICMDTISKSQNVMELPCNHTFHCDCLSKWLIDKDTCPNCRLVIDERSVRG